MSRNSKNARLQKMEEALPKNRSAAAAQRRAEGKPRAQGRATAPKHTKKNAWWQRGLTYKQYIMGQKGRRNSADDSSEGALA